MRRTRRADRIRLIAHLALLLTLAVAMVPRAQAGDLRGTLDRILSRATSEGWRVGARVIEAPTGKVVYSFHATDALVPASNAKLITTAAALDTLGPDFAFTTRIYRRGALDDRSQRVLSWKRTNGRM